MTEPIPDEIRLAVTREICAREGHGGLDEVTTMASAGLLSVYLCRRGCGQQVYEVVRPMTHDRLLATLARIGIEGKPVFQSASIVHVEQP